jgi:hypothetical protein
MPVTLHEFVNEFIAGYPKIAALETPTLSTRATRSNDDYAASAGQHRAEVSPQDLDRMSVIIDQGRSYLSAQPTEIGAQHLAAHFALKAVEMGHGTQEDILDGSLPVVAATSQIGVTRNPRCHQVPTLRKTNAEAIGELLIVAAWFHRGEPAAKTRKLHKPRGYGAHPGHLEVSDSPFPSQADRGVGRIPAG